MGIMAVLMLPLLLLGVSGLLFIYQEASRLWSKSAVQNKVVVITDALSGLGKGKMASSGPVLIPALKGPGDRMVWGSSVGRECRLLLRSLRLSCQGDGRVRMAGAANSQLGVRKYWV